MSYTMSCVYPVKHHLEGSLQYSICFSVSLCLLFQVSPFQKEWLSIFQLMVFKNMLLLYIRSLSSNAYFYVSVLDSPALLSRHVSNYMFYSCKKIEIPVALSANDIWAFMLRTSDWIFFFFVSIVIMWRCQKRWIGVCDQALWKPT